MLCPVSGLSWILINPSFAFFSSLLFLILGHFVRLAAEDSTFCSFMRCTYH